VGAQDQMAKLTALRAFACNRESERGKYVEWHGTPARSQLPQVSVLMLLDGHLGSVFNHVQ